MWAIRSSEREGFGSWRSLPLPLSLPGPRQVFSPSHDGRTCIAPMPGEWTWRSSRDRPWVCMCFEPFEIWHSIRRSSISQTKNSRLINGPLGPSIRLSAINPTSPLGYRFQPSLVVYRKRGLCAFWINCRYAWHSSFSVWSLPSRIGDTHILRTTGVPCQT